jgi:CRP-like cAMP-binding protein
MKPTRLQNLIEKRGQLEKYSAGQVYHAQDFAETMYMLKEGYVKRYQVTKASDPVIELIYGPGHIFPLSQLYKKLFHTEMNQRDFVYVYQAMSNIEIWRLGDDELIPELEKDPALYGDLFYESGLRLRSNINRLASNSLKDDYKKVAHLLVCLAIEFGKPGDYKGKPIVKISAPLETVDMAEQLNISKEVTEAVMNSLCKSNLIQVDGKIITVLDPDLLKDTYL